MLHAKNEWNGLFFPRKKKQTNQIKTTAGSKTHPLIINTFVRARLLSNRPPRPGTIPRHFRTRNRPPPAVVSRPQLRTHCRRSALRIRFEREEAKAKKKKNVA